MLLDVDVVITAISTVGIEGKMLNCGLVSLEGTIYDKVCSYSKLGLSTGVYNTSEIENAIINESKKRNSDLELYENESIENINIIISEIFDS